MTFRTSDILIGGSLIIIGLTEIAHLAGCLLGWSFFDCNGSAALAEVGIVLFGGDIIVCNIQTETKTGHSR